ncbi:nuclear transport factor 2 family protein [Flavihumibacter fluvii]|uniref:nuclear transport factor 2 family protein n=1 Tax=Flavihumibacter fluvii TaxID=2838157 RepID=UPI001BDDF05C|nr:hypothetical protein [Flavihumibacter fluvii]ULQ51009.1 hypothetical protein KJS93_13040 [Flavihumibacter fluvii]
MKKFNVLVSAAVVIAIVVLFTTFFTAGCNGAEPAKEETAKVEPAASTPVAITNPNFTIAPLEYTDLAVKAYEHMSKLEFDAWGDMMSDNVVYSFPDGDVDTRTTLSGKEAVVGWWKNWKEKAGVESMTMSEFNNIPINVIAQPKGGAQLGIYVISYFSNKIVFKGKPVALRMNFSVHFNAEKKIDRYATYYDRSVIIKGTGVDILKETKGKK